MTTPSPLAYLVAEPFPQEVSHDPSVGVVSPDVTSGAVLHPAPEVDHTVTGISTSVLNAIWTETRTCACGETFSSRSGSRHDAMKASLRAILVHVAEAT